MTQVGALHSLLGSPRSPVEAGSPWTLCSIQQTLLGHSLVAGGGARSGAGLPSGSCWLAGQPDLGPAAEYKASLKKVQIEVRSNLWGRGSQSPPVEKWQSQNRDIWKGAVLGGREMGP